ncbi:mucin-associated surface protein (MASP), partial [Trypanosoma conorhini]
MAGRALLVCVLCVLCCAAGGGWAWDHLCPADGKELLNVTVEDGWKFCDYNETFAATTKNKPADTGASAATNNPAGAGAGASTTVGGNGQAVGSAGGAVGGTVPVADVSDGDSRGTGVRGPPAAPPPPPPQVLSPPQTGKGVGRAQSTTEDASKEQKEGEATALAEGARANQPTESSKQSPAHSSPAAEGEDAVVGGPTQEGTVGKAAAEASPPESAVQQNAVQRDNTRASTAVAGETSEAAQDTAG